MIDTVIFDMDGVLIDSEPLWKEAERIVFGSVGVAITKEHSKLTATMTTSEVAQYWFEQQPWKGKSTEAVEKEVIDLVCRLIREEGQAMNGVVELLDFFRNKHFSIGLSTNSPLSLVPIILDKLEISTYFTAISSSEFEQKGKPDPAVYLSTAKKLNILPTNCIVFEDSQTGVEAAKNANMKVIAVPSINDYNNSEFDIADVKIRQLSEFTENHLLTLREKTIYNTR